MNETYMTIAGNVVGEPQVRMTRGNVPFVTFRVASNVRRVDYKSGEYIDAGTNFVNVTAFRSLGVNLANSLGKGQPVLVYGRMRINQWTSGERTGTTVEIDAYNVGHDLSRGQSVFQRIAKPQLNQNDRLADPAVQEASEALDREVRDPVPVLPREQVGEDEQPRVAAHGSLGPVRPVDDAAEETLDDTRGDMPDDMPDDTPDDTPDDRLDGGPGSGLGDELDAVLAADSDDYVLVGAGQR